MRDRIGRQLYEYLRLAMVGAEGFEPPTLCSQSRCATRLRYAPTTLLIVSRTDSWLVGAAPALSGV